MDSRVLVVVCLSLLGLISCQEFPTPLVSTLSTRGLRFALPDQPGLKKISYHYSINQPVQDGTAGQYNEDVTSPSESGDWIHENQHVKLLPGHVVNYWTKAFIKDEVIALFNKTWTYQGTLERGFSHKSNHIPRHPTPHKDGHNRPPPPDQDGHNRPPPPDQDGHKPAKKNKVLIRPAEECEEYPCMIFEDNFDYLDFAVWQHEKNAAGGGNGEFQVYTNNRTNSYVRDGTLYIKPTLLADKKGESFLSSGTLDMWGSNPASYCTSNKDTGCKKTGTANNYLPPALSARLRTVKSFSFRYGRIEAEAQMPRGDWLWPAIWMVPRYQEYGGWPTSGEIDIVESRGNNDLVDPDGNQQGNTHTRSTVLWGVYGSETRGYLTQGCADGDFADTLHTYAMEWSPESVKLLVDDVVMTDASPGEGGFWELGGYEEDLPGVENPWKHGTNLAPFDQEFSIILNVAVGGTGGFFGQNWINNGNESLPWNNNEAATSKRLFWEAKDQWYPTWNPYENNGEDAAMKVNYVRVWKTEPDP